MRIPRRFVKDVEEVVEKLLSSHLDIKAIIVIGSVAMGDHMKDSDVDLVCVTGLRVNLEQRQSLMEDIPLMAQLVVFSEEELRERFEDFSTMAHSIQKGIPVFEKSSFLRPFLEMPLGIPKKKWIKDWFVHWLEFYFMGLHDLETDKEFHEKFCKEKCECFVPDYLARAAVNFSILYLETRGVVPVSKGEIRKGMRNIVPKNIFKGLNTALRICHEGIVMDYYEAVEVKNTATWLKDRLIQKLCVSEEEMERPLKMYKILKAAGKKASKSEEGNP
ncbi:MAG: nucleotidyltransferase domain-containing protein [Desulfobacterales bacterium]|nr:nucleotidyltransferase domain-containing protein [Desulfobacterales bacterium]